MFLMSTNTLQAPKHSKHPGDTVVAVMMRLNGFESAFEYDQSYNCKETSSGLS